MGIQKDLKKNNGKGGLRTPDLTVISRALYQAKPLKRCFDYKNLLSQAAFPFKD